MKWFVCHQMLDESPWPGFDTKAEAIAWRNTALAHFGLDPYWLEVRKGCAK